MEEQADEHLASQDTWPVRGVFTKILVASDGSEGAFKAVTTALKLARQSHAELHMLSVTEITHFPSTMGEVKLEQERAHKRLGPPIERAKKLAAFQGLTLECHLLPGHPVQTILNFARDRGFDLLIIGFGRHSTLYNRFIGSTTDWLVELAPCAVLVVK
jgi:nucleotide-binding universal stress UspA family protein